MSGNSWKEYNNETNLFAAEPNVGATMSWRKLADVTDETKATLLYFSAIAEAKAKLYIAATVRKGNHSYAKLYIVQHGNVNILYVKSDAVCQGKRYHRNQQEN